MTVNRAEIDHLDVTGGSLAIVAGTSTAPYHVESVDRFDNPFDVTDQAVVSITPFDTGAHCVSPSAQPTCTATAARKYAVRVSAFGSPVTRPLQVNPQPVLDHIVLSGGPTGTGERKNVTSPSNGAAPMPAIQRHTASRGRTRGPTCANRADN